jgi:hypothetical protein
MSDYNILDFLNTGNPNVSSSVRASWLDDFGADTWLVDGEKKIEWSYSLCDGTNLLDKENEYFLSVIKEFVYESRTSYLTPDCGTEKVMDTALYTKLIADWMIKNQDTYNTKPRAFANLDSDGIKSIIHTYVNEGSYGLASLEFRARALFTKVLTDSSILNEINESEHKFPATLTDPKLKSVVSNYYNEAEGDTIRKWLYLQGCYAKTTKREKQFGLLHELRPGKLNQIISSNITKYVPPQLTLLLREFESIQSYEHQELYRAHRCKAYLPQGYKTLEQRSAEKCTLDGSSKIIAVINKFSVLTDEVEGLPNRLSLESVDAFSVAREAGARRGSHTRTTPASIALKALEESVTYILKYSKPLTKLYLDVAEARASNSSMPEICESLSDLNLSFERSHWMSERLGGNRGQKQAKGSAERGENAGHSGGTLCREELPLNDAISFLFAAIFILTATMSARRISELMRIIAGSVIGEEGNYHLRIQLAKVTVGGVRAEIIRPIPDLVASSIESLIEFKEKAYKNKTLTKTYDSVFTFNHNDFSFSQPTEIVHRFTDYIGLPADKDGRRWYHKNHEFRRFFAIVFFWQYKFSNLSAISWMLGHGDPRETYKYIKESIGGSELTEVEAKFIAETLRDSSSEIEEIKTLKAFALKHFQTTDIGLIEADDLELYIEDLLEQELVSVVPHFFENDDGVKIEMVFEIHGDIE